MTFQSYNNPHYDAYCAAFGCTEQEAHEDADRREAGEPRLHVTMTYPEWIRARKLEFQKEHPEAFFHGIGTGPVHNPGPPRLTGHILDHAAWGSFLKKCGEERRTA